MAHLSESRGRCVKWGRSSCWLFGGGYGGVSGFISRIREFENFLMVLIYFEQSKREV